MKVAICIALATLLGGRTISPARAQSVSSQVNVVDPGGDEPASLNLNPNSPGGLLPYDYYLPPAAYLADSSKSQEQNDGRVLSVLRWSAQTRDAHSILANAVRAHLAAESGSGSPSEDYAPLPEPKEGYHPPSSGTRQPAPSPRQPQSRPGQSTCQYTVGPADLWARLAQLAVTGRQAFATFAAWHPQDGDLVQYVLQTNRGHKLDTAVLQTAAHKVLDVAYSTLWAIRANDANWRAFRPQLGWIAVSGEDDLPHRPTNISTSMTATTPAAFYPQYDVGFAIPGVAGAVNVTTRYMVASVASALVLPAKVQGPPPAPRSIPSDGRPNIPAQNKIIIYIHGGGSRLEEAVPLAYQLIQAGARKGIPYTVISFDMPNSGLSSPFDHTLVANTGPGGALGSYKPPHGDPNKPIPNPPFTYGYPIMDTEEQYVLNFLDAIDQQIGNVKSRIVAVMGGSLGGNMSLRLARRANQYPYLRNIVSWSVTCMQSSQDDNIVGHIGGLIGNYTQPEQDGTRHDFFDNLYNNPLVSPAVAAAIGGASSGGVAGALSTVGLGELVAVGGAVVGGVTFNLPPQPQLWYRDGWPLKKSLIQQTKFDRYEYYTPEYRRWTYRLNYEMTIYSFQDGDLYAPNRAQGPPRYLTVNARLLLASGDQDEHDPLYKLYSSTRDVAQKMSNTPGSAILIRNTGHSIHDERPAYFAEQIVDFLVHPSAPAPRQLSVSAIPQSVRINVPTDVVVQVTDPATRRPVPGAVVHVGNQLVPAGLHFQHVFTCLAPQTNPRTPRNTVGEPADFAAPRFAVSAPGYQQSNVEFTVLGIQPGSRMCK